MKVFFMFITTVVCNITYGHKNPVVKQAYSNVIITTSASDYVEEMNKTLIIGQYAEILLRKHVYEDNIYLYFLEEQMEQHSIIAWLPKLTDNSDNVDGVNIIFKMHHYSIEGCLKVIENAILNKKRLSRFSNKQQEIYNGVPSTIVKEVLQVKINRPSAIKELDKAEEFGYFVQEGTYHFTNTINGKSSEIGTFDNILDYQVLQQDIVVIFTKEDELKIIRSNSTLLIQRINNTPKFYWPYKVRLLGKNKITIEFSGFSESKNRVMLYHLDSGIFIQDLDKTLESN